MPPVIVAFSIETHDSMYTSVKLSLAYRAYSSLFSAVNGQSSILWRRVVPVGIPIALTLIIIITLACIRR